MRLIYRYWKFGFVMLCLSGAVLLSSQQEAPGPVYTRLYGSYPLPEQMSFAGEPVPLHIADVAERMDRELQSNAYFHSNTILALKRLTRFLPEIEALLREEGLPDDVKYVALAESLFGNVVSPAGAAGFWQLMPATARGAGLIINNEIDERYHLTKATRVAARYLKVARNKFNSWTSAAAAYNRGMGGLQKAMDTQRVSSFYDLYLNEETYRYIFRILALKEVMEHPVRYGFDTTRLHGYQPLPTRTVVVTETIDNLPQFALEQGTNYKTLRLYNPWIKGYRLTVSSAIPQYELRLPE